MMKQEFDKIANENGYGDVDYDLYHEKIEPVYMELGDMLNLDKKDMVKMFYENGGYLFEILWDCLKQIRQLKSAQKAADEVFRSTIGREIPIMVQAGFLEAEKEIRSNALYWVKCWRTKKA